VGGAASAAGREKKRGRKAYPAPFFMYHPRVGAAPLPSTGEGEGKGEKGAGAANHRSKTQDRRRERGGGFFFSAEYPAGWKSRKRVSGEKKKKKKGEASPRNFLLIRPLASGRWPPPVWEKKEKVPRCALRLGKVALPRRERGKGVFGCPFLTMPRNWGKKAASHEASREGGEKAQTNVAPLGSQVKSRRVWWEGGGGEKKEPNPSLTTVRIPCAKKKSRFVTGRGDPGGAWGGGGKRSINYPHGLGQGEEKGEKKIDRRKKGRGSLSPL